MTFLSLNFIPSSLTWFVCFGLGLLIDTVGGGDPSVFVGQVYPQGPGVWVCPAWDGAQPGWAPGMVLLQADVGVFQPGAVWGCVTQAGDSLPLPTCKAIFRASPQAVNNS